MENGKVTNEHNFKVGDIIYNSWGWEQTNIDFYQVVDAKPKTIKIAPINGKFRENQPHGNGMSAYVVPVPNKFCGDPIAKRVLSYKHNGKKYIKAEFGCFQEYKDKDGVYCSWYA